MPIIEDPTRPDKPLRLKQGFGFVYFIECGDFVKIGYTSGPVKKRVSNIAGMTPFPVSLLATINGVDTKAERQLHGRFASARHSGEWFHKTPDLLNFIDSINRAPAMVAA